jgi:hypothetical protein
MKAAKTNLDELKISGSEFDRIMGQALQVRPGDDKKIKASAKTKRPRKNRAK